MRLDLACGTDCAEGFDGVDWRPLPGVVHVRALNLKSWDYYNAAELRELGHDYDAITADFEVTEREAIISPDLAGQYPDGVPDFMIFHCVNVINDVRVLLKKRG